MSYFSRNSCNNENSFGNLTRGPRGSGLKGSTLQEFRFENICNARDNAGTRVEKRGESGIDHFPSLPSPPFSFPTRFEKILVRSFSYNLAAPLKKNSIKFNEIINDISIPCFNNIYVYTTTGKIFDSNDISSLRNENKFETFKND